DIDTLRIAGLIDFGDSLYTPVAMECAIPCTYVMMDKPDPLAAAVTVLRGFQSVHQMSEREIELMPLMIAGRLLLSLCLARQRQLEEPDNEYLQISAAGGWRLLHQLRNRSMTYIRSMFRFAAGLEPCRNSIAVRTYLRKASFTSVIRASRSGTPLQSLDLSVGSKLLGNNSSFDTTNAFNNRIRQVLDPDKIAVGKYLEPRPFYSADSYKIEGNDGREWRTIHMGLDLFAPVGTSILAPHRGQVQAVTYNTGFRDYGHTVILRHETDEGVPFFTLYGHLGSSCLQLLKPGQLIDADEIVGMVGDLHENGEWPPHLHFQVIVHMLDEQYNFPGVVAPRWVDVWQSLCPDPNLILKLPSATTHVEKNSSTRLMTARRELLSSNLSLSYDVPLHIVRGYGSYLYENNGRKYLDLVNNVAHVGHEHPKIVQAAQDQMAVLNTNTRYLHENLLLFAEEVEQCMPAGLETIFVCNSGSEANELALRIAKTVTGRDQFIAIEHGYHGHTNACIEVSSYKFDGPGGLGRPDHVHLVPRPDSYRGIYREGIDSLGTKYAAHVDDCLDTMAQKEKGVAAFIGETILSCGGQIIPPKGYLQEVYQRVREAGGLCIADEVQTGCGRVGSHFWAFETQGVIPDIVTIGKPIGNGHPLGVVVTTRAVEETFANGMEYFNTFGGNPVSCAVGSTVLQVIREEGLQQKAMDSGAYLKERLVDLQQSSSIMGDVRGAGLFIGIEFVRDRKTKTPFASAAHYLVNRLRDQGILLSTDGPDHNVIKIKPPLGVDRDDLDYFLERFEHTMRDTYLRSNH
ncbi:MAG: aminotransferase class III-fold pyridoxal phosphate-dependent enzyme, partial [Saprospiraceae bacterium]|nr:aminotransferase class III-fold pyridoxal phosphate-dependent enzyme [Saprospiraceae bacterium]